MTEAAAKWDLTQLVSDPDTDKVAKEMENAVNRASEFRAKYQGKIRDLDAAGLLKFIEERDDVFLPFEGAFQYARLSYSADSTDPAAKKLNDVARKAGTRAGQQLAFAEIELGELLKAKPQLVDDPKLAEYHHYLERALKRVPHQLSESEERLIMAKDQNGIDAWSQLQGDWLSTRTFKMTVDGEDRILPYGQIIGYYQDPDRVKRREANRVVYDGLGKDEIVWASALRSVAADHLQMMEWRKYSSPLEPSLNDNDVDEASVDALMKVMRESVGVYRRYLVLKAKMMGLEKLGNWDVVAPLPHAPDKHYSWEDSRAEVVRAYTKFDEQFGEWAEDMYKGRRLDGQVRKGKVSGAFCSYWYGGRTAFVLQSFTGRMGDVYTQAHELGHAIHGYIGSRHQRPSNFEMGPCIAESSSIFGELLLTDQLLGEAKSDAERQAVLSNVLDEFGMAAFQVSARYFFEKSLYEAIENGTFLDGETISELWVRARDDVYGDAVDWLPEMKWEWTMKLHYYMPNYRFYNYPYVFAQLFVFALYRLYLEQGREFVPKMKALLAAGSSRSPAELAREMGFDIRTEAFWRKGIEQFEEFLGQLERTL